MIVYFSQFKGVLLMEMESTVQLSYIANDLEKNVIMSLKDAYDFHEIYEFQGTELIVKENVQFLHFKHFCFPTVSVIKCLCEETVLVLEQCYFLKSTVFVHGFVTVLSPQFDNVEGKYLLYNLKFFQNSVVELVLEKTNKKNFNKNIYSFQNVNELKLSGDLGNAIVFNCDKDSFKMKKFFFHSAFNYHGSDFLVEQLQIKNSKIAGIDHFDYEELQIENSCIYSEVDENVLHLDQGKVTIKNSSLYGDKIFLFHTVYEPSKGVLNVSNTEEKREALLKSRIQLLHCLKAIEKEKNQVGKTFFSTPRSLDQAVHFYAQVQKKGEVKDFKTTIYFETAIAPILRKEMLIHGRKK